ncbi:hypothetical protein [Paenibacillus ihumii]|uniref:hypothetical protein n=1 Tax=Paenibacillus ihumii TaxID=687436 RepID=UPI0006D7BE42|nr:hypothetical protein [Paenibacillus ihumii]
MFAIYHDLVGDIAKVKAIIHNPYPEQIEENGLHVESLPISETPEGMYPVLMINLSTGEMFYNYEVLPVQIPDNEIADKVTALESDLGNLLLENAADKATIATLEDTVGNLLLEVATLKGGAE